MAETNAAYVKQTHKRMQRVFSPSLSLNSHAFRPQEFLYGPALFKDYKPPPSRSEGLSYRGY